MPISHIFIMLDIVDQPIVVVPRIESRLGDSQFDKLVMSFEVILGNVVFELIHDSIIKDLHRLD